MFTCGDFVPHKDLEVHWSLIRRMIRTLQLSYLCAEYDNESLQCWLCFSLKLMSNTLSVCVCVCAGCVVFPPEFLSQISSLIHVCPCHIYKSLQYLC